MGIGHQQVPRSDARNPLVLNGPRRKRAMFANDVIVPDHEPRRLGVVLFILGIASDSRSMIDVIALADVRNSRHAHTGI